MTDADWRLQGACRKISSALADRLFFDPDIYSNPASGAAKAVCASCPVSTPCLRQGMREPGGVWGGLSPWEREQVRRHRHDPLRGAV